MVDEISADDPSLTPQEEARVTPLSELERRDIDEALVCSRQVEGLSSDGLRQVIERLSHRRCHMPALKYGWRQAIQ